MHAEQLVHGTHKREKNYMMARQVVIQQKSQVYDDWLFSLMNHTIEWNESIGVFGLNEPIEPIESTGGFYSQTPFPPIGKIDCSQRNESIGVFGLNERNERIESTGGFYAKTPFSPIGTIGRNG
jgi:hypothetical protein